MYRYFEYVKLYAVRNLLLIAVAFFAALDVTVAQPGLPELKGKFKLKDYIKANF